MQADPLQLHLSYREALRALQVGRRAAGRGQVSLFAALGLDRLLLSCPVDELDVFHTATLGPVIAYEAEHPGCGLLATLDAFLAADRNVARAARVLFVHYNTVKYRLERLESLLGPFIAAPDRCLALELALRVGTLARLGS
jgi:purine catabolism regulator